MKVVSIEAHIGSFEIETVGLLQIRFSGHKRNRAAMLIGLFADCQRYAYTEASVRSRIYFQWKRFYMKRSKFSDSPKVDAFKRVEAGIGVPDICRELGIGTAAFYKWRAKYVSAHKLCLAMAA